MKKSKYELSKYNSIFDKKDDDKQKCLHKSCPDCEGTGTKENGEPCIHHISCPCPKCNAQY